MLLTEPTPRVDMMRLIHAFAAEKPHFSKIVRIGAPISNSFARHSEPLTWGTRLIAISSD
jgi:hypothetical protein